METGSPYKGYKCLRLTYVDDKFSLVSPYRRDVWHGIPPRLIAKVSPSCHYSSAPTYHSAPDQLCSCGVYIGKGLAWTLDQTSPTAMTAYLYCCVEGSGVVVEAENGARVQHATVNLIVPRPCGFCGDLAVGIVWAEDYNGNWLNILCEKCLGRRPNLKVYSLEMVAMGFGIAIDWDSWDSVKILFEKYRDPYE